MITSLNRYLPPRVHECYIFMAPGVFGFILRGLFGLHCSYFGLPPQVCTFCQSFANLFAPVQFALCVSVIPLCLKQTGVTEICLACFCCRTVLLETSHPIPSDLSWHDADNLAVFYLANQNICVSVLLILVFQRLRGPEIKLCLKQWIVKVQLDSWAWVCRCEQ